MGVDYFRVAVISKQEWSRAIAENTKLILDLSISVVRIQKVLYVANEMNSSSIV